MCRNLPTSWCAWSWNVRSITIAFKGAITINVSKSVRTCYLSLTTTTIRAFRSFAWSDMLSSTVHINCNRYAVWESSNRGITSSHSTPYHPTDNAQVERHHGFCGKRLGFHRNRIDYLLMRGNRFFLNHCMLRVIALCWY